MITGSEDGFIRGVSIYPNKVLSLLGQHSDNENENFPIERISISRCKNFVASISHDYCIKFHDISNFVDKRKEITEITMVGDDEKKEEKKEEIKDEMNDEKMEIEESVEKDETKKKKKSFKTNLKKQEVENQKHNMKGFFSDLF